MEKHSNLIGLDIGGTKCAVVLGRESEAGVLILDRIAFPTVSCAETIAALKEQIRVIVHRNGLETKDIAAIGISCGGPLDSHRGIVMSPPNLPGWDGIPIVKIMSDEFGVPCGLQNDANACALAEWRYGAGKGSRNMAFLTFGTGLGAGLVLDGKLYSGTNDNAGELGHIRLSPFGPVGYGKAGSFEGFASGGGIAQLAASAVKEKLMMGEKVAWCPDGDLGAITAKTVAEAAAAGDELAIGVYKTSATYLGKALSILIDIVNPEVIAIGSIFVRAEELIRPFMQAVIDREALPAAAAVCKVKPAELGEQIGDFASLSIAASL